MKQSDWFARLITLNWWSKSEAVLISRLSSRSIWKIFTMFAVIGVSMRLYTQAQPASYMFHAYDFQSYLLVAESISKSESPYNTGRYNYGPIWAIMVWLVKAICGNDDSFRLGLTFVLILADLGIALWLKKNSYLFASLFILVSPISVAITSRHLQFDNLAVLFALLGVSQISQLKSKSVTNHDILACLFFALSLMTKHIFIIFPLWIALRETSLKRKSLFLFLPLGTFLVSLVPFWFENPKSVIDNVITYSSLKNAPFLYAFLPDGLVDSLIASHFATLIFLSIVGLVGFRLKHIPVIQLPLVYMVTIVVFSSAIADQYLAIPIAAALVFLNLGFFLWLVLVAVYFAGNPLTQNWWGFRTVWNWTAKEWLPYATPDWMGLYRDQFVFLFLGWLLLMNGLRKPIIVKKEKTQPQISTYVVQECRYLHHALLIATLLLALPFSFNLLPTTGSIVVFEQIARNEGVKVNAGEPLCAALVKGDEVNIHLSGEITRLYNHQNLFQTSNMNAGIRLEIDEFGQAGLVIGSNGANGYSVVPISEKFKHGKFDLAINIRHGNNVAVSFQNEKTEKVIKGLNPKCDNIIVGYGYDSSRVVRGEVQFIASAPNSVPRFVPRWLDVGVRTGWFSALNFAVFYFGLFLVAFKLSGSTDEKTEIAHEEHDHV